MVAILLVLSVDTWREEKEEENIKEEMGRETSTDVIGSKY